MAYRDAGPPSLAARVRVVSATPEKPKAWAIASFYIAGAAALIFGVARWATQSQADLAANDETRQTTPPTRPRQADPGKPVPAPLRSGIDSTGGHMAWFIEGDHEA
jgi:type IV secretory pathway VirB10-like protein